MKKVMRSFQKPLDLAHSVEWKENSNHANLEPFDDFQADNLYFRGDG